MESRPCRWNCWRPRRRPSALWGVKRRIMAMSAATSPGTGLAYGACGGSAPPGAWPDSSFYGGVTLRPARRAAAGKASGTEDAAISDQALRWRSKPVLEASPWEGEGYRKVWALRVCRDIRACPQAGARALMRENNLLSPHRCRRRGGNRPWAAEIITHAPKPHVGHRWRSGVHGGRRLGLDTGRRALERRVVSSTATGTPSATSSNSTMQKVLTAPVSYT